MQNGFDEEMSTIQKNFKQENELLIENHEKELVCTHRHSIFVVVIFWKINTIGGYFCLY